MEPETSQEIETGSESASSAISPATIASELELFIRKRFQISDNDEAFGRETDLWDQGYLDSLGVVEVIDFLQNRLHLTIPSQMLFDPDFVRINGIAQLVSNLANSILGVL